MPSGEQYLFTFETRGFTEAAREMREIATSARSAASAVERLAKAMRDLNNEMGRQRTGTGWTAGTAGATGTAGPRATWTSAAGAAGAYGYAPPGAQIGPYQPWNAINWWSSVYGSAPSTRPSSWSLPLSATSTLYGSGTMPPGATRGGGRGGFVNEPPSGFDFGGLGGVGGTGGTGGGGRAVDSLMSHTSRLGGRMAYIGEWFAFYEIIHQVGAAMSEFMRVQTEMDANFAQYEISMRGATSSTREYLETVNRISRATGVSPLEIAPGVTLQERILNSPNDIAMRASQVQRVFGVDNLSAQRDLLSLTKQFPDRSTIEILDALTGAWSRSALSMEEFFSLSETMGPLAQQFNTSLESMSGMFAGLTTVTGESGEAIELFWRQMDRVYNDPDTRGAIEQAMTQRTGKPYSVAGYNDQGIEVRKPMNEILGDMNRYLEQSDIIKIADTIPNMLGQKTRPIFIALMEGWGNVDDAIKAATESSGAFDDANRRMMDTLAADVDELTAAWQRFLQSLGGEHVVSVVLNVVTDILDWATIPTRRPDEEIGPARAAWRAAKEAEEQEAARKATEAQTRNWITLPRTRTTEASQEAYAQFMSGMQFPMEDMTLLRMPTGVPSWPRTDALQRLQEKYIQPGQVPTSPVTPKLPESRVTLPEGLTVETFQAEYDKVIAGMRSSVDALTPSVAESTAQIDKLIGIYETEGLALDEQGRVLSRVTIDSNVASIALANLDDQIAALADVDKLPGFEGAIGYVETELGAESIQQIQERARRTTLMELNTGGARPEDRGTVIIVNEATGEKIGQVENVLPGAVSASEGYLASVYNEGVQTAKAAAAEAEANAKRQEALLKRIADGVEGFVSDLLKPSEVSPADMALAKLHEEGNYTEDQFNASYIQHWDEPVRRIQDVMDRRAAGKGGSELGPWTGFAQEMGIDTGSIPGVLATGEEFKRKYYTGGFGEEFYDQYAKEGFVGHAKQKLEEMEGKDRLVEWGKKALMESGLSDSISEYLAREMSGDISPLEQMMLGGKAPEEVAEDMGPAISVITAATTGAVSDSLKKGGFVQSFANALKMDDDKTADIVRDAGYKLGLVLIEGTSKSFKDKLIDSIVARLEEEEMP